MANLVNFDDEHFFASLDGDDSPMLTDCPETQIIDEQLSANQSPLKRDDSSEVVMIEDQNLDQHNLTKEELLGPQSLQKNTFSIENQDNCKNGKIVPYESSRPRNQISETVPFKILPGRSILKKVVKSTTDHENQEQNSFNFDLSVQDPKIDYSDQPSCSTKNNTKINNPLIKFQDENSTRIVIDYDIKDNRKQLREQEQKSKSQSELLIKEQSEISNNQLLEYCQICCRLFSCKKARRRHMRKAHSIVNQVNTLSKCLDCNKDFKLRSEFRDHLEKCHNLNMTPVMLFFPTLDAFFTWKCNIEREGLCAYHLAKGGAVTRYFCSRSGIKYTPPKKRKSESRRMRGIQSSIKLGVGCPSEIKVEKSPKGVLVTYYSTHYGHGEEMGITSVLPAEKAAVEELVSKGFSFEELMKELKGGEITDSSQAVPLRKRYLNWVKQTFLAPQYYDCLTDTECIVQWVQKCCNMEECPILLCHLGNMNCPKELFIVVIMTEFQKQILLSNSKDLICIDLRIVSKVALLVLYVMDELHHAFPVAYCLCNGFNKNTVTQFFMSIKEHTGSLHPKYLMSSIKPCIFDAWVDVMNDRPQWLWSDWSVKQIIRKKLQNRLKEHVDEKFEIFNTMTAVIDCKSKDVFSCMYGNLIDKLKTNAIFEKFSEWLEKNFGSNCEKWAHCYRKDISYKTSLHLESLHHTIDTACSKALERKSMFSLIHVLMKVLRNRMMDRIIDSFDDEKINLALHAINLCHETSMNIPEEDITSTSEKLWNIKTDDGEYEFVVQETETCPDHCALKCKKCSICVHMYSCSCVHNMISSNLCQHIHAVAYMISKKQSSEIASSSTNETSTRNNSASKISIDDFPFLEKHVHDSIDRDINAYNASPQNDESTSTEDWVSSQHVNDSEEAPSFEPSFSTSSSDNVNSKQAALKKITELYQIVKNNKLTDSTLKSLTKHLNMCRKTVSRNKVNYYETMTPSTIPINAVYLIKPKNSANSEPKPKNSIKRFMFPSLEERNADLKKFKMNLSSEPKISTKKVMETLLRDQRLQVKKLTHTPLMLTLK